MSSRVPPIVNGKQQSWVGASEGLGTLEPQESLSREHSSLSAQWSQLESGNQFGDLHSSNAPPPQRLFSEHADVWEQLQ